MASSRFAGLATGLRDLNIHVNAIAKALSKGKVSDNPNQQLLEEARFGRVRELGGILEELGDAIDVNKVVDDAGFSPLCLACAHGHEDAALFLLTRAGADPNNVDTGWGATVPTPLMLAAGTGLSRVVDELLSRGARVDARRGGDGWTALHACAAHGHALIMGALLASPLADAGVRTSKLETPLSIACSAGHLAIVDMLLSDNAGFATNHAGADGTASSPQLIPVAGPPSSASSNYAEERTWGGRTPLQRAAAGGHVEVRT
ncbi:unnamed protein product [Discosporangium mesarthrocarpum]